MKGFNDIIRARDNFGITGNKGRGNGIIGANMEGNKGKIGLGRRGGSVTGAGRNGILGIIGNIGRRSFTVLGIVGNFGNRGNIATGQGKSGVFGCVSERIGSDNFKGGGFKGSLGRGRGVRRGLECTLMTTGDLCEIFFIITGAQ